MKLDKWKFDIEPAILVKSLFFLTIIMLITETQFIRKNDNQQKITFFFYLTGQFHDNQNIKLSYLSALSKPSILDSIMQLEKQFGFNYS